MTQEQISKLLEPFTADEVQWRLRNQTESGGYAVPYLDSRAIQNRLDEVLGKENWQNNFVAVPTGNTKDPTVNVCVISIYHPDRGEWISKSDGAGASDIEPVKGGLSDAFKRAASMWGVGRYMYQLDEQWVDIESKGKSKAVAKKSYPKLKAYYEKTVATIFGAAPQRLGGKKPETPPKAETSAHTPSEPPAASPKKQNTAVPFYTVISASINKGKNDTVNTAVELIKPNGGTVTAYIRGNPGIKQGQKLSHVKTTEMNHEGVGKYYIIDEYQLAA